MNRKTIPQSDIIKVAANHKFNIRKKRLSAIIVFVAAIALLPGCGGGGLIQTGLELTPTIDNPPVSGVKQVVVGNGYSCALMYDKTVKCWGANKYGQLGNGTTTYSVSPVKVTGLNNAISISASSFHHTCVITSHDSVKCWGSNAFGQLGNGSYDDSTEPVQVSGLSGSTAVLTGSYHTCALLSNGTVKCWGDNYFGQLGNGKKGYYTAPVDVIGL